MRIHCNIDGSESIINLLVESDIKLADILKEIAKKRGDDLSSQLYQFKEYNPWKKQKSVIYLFNKEYSQLIYCITESLIIHKYLI